MQICFDEVTNSADRLAETEWRKNPTHQGGFLLDGGVHFTAGLRLLPGPENTISHLSAFTMQLRKDMPPFDTMDAAIRT